MREQGPTRPGGWTTTSAALAVLAFVALAALAGCGDLFGPAFGSLEVRANVTGIDPDLDGFTITVDQKTRALGLGGTVIFTDLEVGVYEAQIGDLASNCSVPTSVGRVTITEDDTTSLAYPVTCLAREGTVEVSATTTGDDPDADGYRVALGTDTLDVEPNGSVSFEGVHEGPTMVRLLDVAPNCTVEGANPRSTQVTVSETATVSFAITCETDIGALQVAVSSAGDDVPAEYRVAVGQDTVDVASDGSVLVEGLPGGPTPVELLVPGSCAVEGANPRSVDVVFADTAETAYTVRCASRTGNVGVTAATAGEDQDPDGYRVAIAGDTLRIGKNERILFRSVHEGAVDVRLLDISDNCSVAGDNPQSVDVAYRQTTEVAFSLTCTSRRGAIEVDMTVLGNDVDTAFLLAVNSDTSQIAWNETRVFEGIPEGTATLELLDIADNCTLEGDNPRNATVVWQDTVNVGFAVTCALSVGAIRVETVTTGEDLDSDGYSATFRGSVFTVGINDMVVWPVRAGDITVELGDVAPNCTVVSANPKSRIITHADTSTTTFEVECLRRVGAVEVSVSTTGQDRDVDGYQVAVDGDTVDVGLNDTVVLENIDEGAASVELLDVAGNCTVQSTNPVPVTIPFRDTTAAAFEVDCDLGLIAFASDRDSDVEIWVLDPTGVQPDRAVTSSGALDQYPTWSPDNARIAFYSDRDANREVYTITSGGTAALNITARSNAQDWVPDWGADNRIYFSSNRNGTYDLYSTDALGGNLKRLTDFTGTETYPSVSPDGSQLVFASNQIDGVFQIFVMSTTGQPPVRRITDGPDSKIFPKWSPDGTKILYVSYPDPNGPGDIFVMDVDGGNVTQLTLDPADDTTPAWSTGGEFIVFASDRDGDYELYRMDADGSRVRRLTNNDDFDAFPSWEK